MAGLKAERIDVPEDIVEVTRVFNDKGWGDGLPIVPPTEQRVEAMIHGTLRQPDEVIGLIPPRMAEATVEKIGISSVMAGCDPEHMPVLIAALEGMIEEKFNLYGVQATTHPCGPMLILNGPIRKRLGINCRYGVFGPGTSANAVIGRAIRLILINIGGAIPGEVDKATHGQPGKYSCVIGESEEESPWDPLSIERGFRPDQSTVTVVAAEAPHNVNDHYSVCASSILTTVSGTLACQGNNNIMNQLGEPVIVLGPEHARTIAQDGYNKKSIKEFIFQKARLSKKVFSSEHQTLRFAHCPDELLTACREAEDIMVIVAGGAGKHSMVVPTFGNTFSVTKAIEN